MPQMVATHRATTTTMPAGSGQMASSNAELSDGNRFFVVCAAMAALSQRTGCFWDRP